MASALAAMSSSEPAAPCDAGSSRINWAVTSAVPPAVASSNAATRDHLGMVSLLEVVEAYRTGLPAKFHRLGWRRSCPWHRRRSLSEEIGRASCRERVFQYVEIS